MRIPTAMTMVLLCGLAAAYAGTSIRLSPDSVAALAVSQSLTARTSELTLESRQRAVQGAAAGLLPSVSASAGYTRLSKQPTFGGGGGGTSLLDTMIAHDTGRVLDPGDYAVLVALGSSFSAPMTLGPQNIVNIGLTLSQPIFTGGKLLNSIRMAQHAHDAQVFTHERTLTEVRLAALKMYWNYVSLVKSRQAFQEGEAWLQKLVNDLQKLFDNGMIIELDLLNSKVSLDTYRSGAIKLENASRTLGEQMLLFLGLDPSLSIELDSSRWTDRKDDFVPPLPDSVENWLVYRDDLRAFDLQLQTVRDLRRLQLASYAPTLIGYAAYNFSNQYTAEESELEANPSVGLSLNWTIFDWGKSWRDAQGTECRIRQTAMLGNNLRAQVRLKYRELARAVEESRATLAIAGVTLENARKALDIARVRYDAGETTNTELLNAQSQLTQKSVEYAQARVRAILALEEYRVAPMGMSGQTSGSP